jgi:hypothetical protein
MRDDDDTPRRSRRRGHETPDEDDLATPPSGGTSWTSKRILLGTAALGAVFVVLCCGGLTCTPLFKKSMEAARKAEADPKSKRNAERKLQAFRAIVSHFQKMPDPLEGKSAYTTWETKVDKLFEEYDAIPFDPTAHRTEAKRMVEMYDREIQGKFRGDRTNLFSNRVQEMAVRLLD